MYLAPNWRKASKSGNNGGCVEVADNQPDAILVRDTKNPDDGTLHVSRANWAAFLSDLKAGHYDLT